MVIAVTEHDPPVNRAAPGDLEIVQRLVNTLDLETGEETLDGRWLRGAGLAAPGEDLAAADLDRVRVVREGLREALLANHEGARADGAAIRALEREAARAPLVVAVTSERPLLAPAGEGVDAVIGRVLAIVARARADGTWERLKVCPADDCRWAFYDHSRNRSRTWCSMSICGNRAKARAFRERRRG